MSTKSKTKPISSIFNKTDGPKNSKQKNAEDANFLNANKNKPLKKKPDNLWVESKVDGSEVAGLKSMSMSPYGSPNIPLLSDNNVLRLPRDDAGLDNSRTSKRNGANVINGSFTASVQSARNHEPPKKKTRRVFLVVMAVIKFWRILEHIKQYGTSSNLYNIAFRSRKSVKRSIFPIAKHAIGVKVKHNMFCLFHPNSPFLAIWNIVLMAFVIYAMSAMPYLAVFLKNPDPWHEAFEDFMDICFMIDVVINFFTAYINAKGDLVTNRWLIAKNYFKTYLILDVISSIPFGLIFNNVSSFNKLLRLFKLPRMIKMIKVARLFKFRDYYRGTSLSYFIRIHGGLIKTIMLGVVTIIMLHLATCIWCAIGMIESDAPFTWIDRYQLSNSSNFEIYLTGLYFCLVSLTTVGYGDYTAYTNTEICFCILWMLIGVAFYSFTIGIISAFFTGKETKDSLLSKKLNNLDEFCKELNIKDETKQKLKASIEYSANKITYQWLDPKQVIFNELPMRLKYELLVSLYKKLILDCPFFNSFDISFVIKIVPLLKPLFVKAGDTIWTEGDYSSFGKSYPNCSVLFSCWTGQFLHQTKVR